MIDKTVVLNAGGQPNLEALGHTLYVGRTRKYKDRLGGLCERQKISEPTDHGVCCLFGIEACKGRPLSRELVLCSIRGERVSCLRNIFNALRAW